MILNKKNFKAFSVAEATIALLIGSIVLGVSAPIITKQIKHNNLSDTQTQVLIREIEKLKIPSGAVMYFDSTSCPNGWHPLTKKYANAAGSFIRNLGETVKEGADARALGSYQKSAIPDIELALRVDYGRWEDNYGESISKYGNDDNYGGALIPTGGDDEPMYNMSNAVDTKKGGDLIKSDVYDKNVDEVRPNNIALLACRKD